MKLVILLTVAAMIVMADAKILPKLDLYKLVVSNDIDDTEVLEDQELSNTAVVSRSLYIPMELKQCNNNACNAICKALGFNHGNCVSSNTCHCYN